jgi:hypothetical protein
MSEKHPLDELFREQLNDHSYEAPMHVWDRIAEQRQSTQTIRRSKKWMPWAGLFLVLIGIGALLWQVADQSDDLPIPGPDFSHPSPAIAPATANNILPPQAPSSTRELLADAQASLAAATYTQKTDRSPVIVASLPARNEQSVRARSVVRHVRVTRLPMANRSLPPESNPGASVILLPSRQATVDNPIVEEELACAKFEETRIWTSSIDFMVSPDIVSRTLEPISPQFTEYAQARNASESFRYGFSAGVRFSTTSPAGFAVRSGLNYSQINEQFTYETEEEERITVTTAYGPNGQVIGTDTVVDFVSLQQFSNNRYTTVDIPLLVGYEFSAGSKFRVSLNGGTFINMLFTQSGEFLSPSTFEPVAFSGDRPDTYHAYRNRLGLAMYGSVGVTYRLNDQFDILVEPHFKWRPQSVTVPGYVLDQRYFTSGLFIGFRKKV